MGFITYNITMIMNGSRESSDTSNAVGVDEYSNKMYYTPVQRSIVLQSHKWQSQCDTNGIAQESRNAAIDHMSREETSSNSKIGGPLNYQKLLQRNEPRLIEKSTLYDFAFCRSSVSGAKANGF